MPHALKMSHCVSGNGLNRPCSLSEQLSCCLCVCVHLQRSRWKIMVDVDGSLAATSAVKVHHGISSLPFSPLPTYLLLHHLSDTLSPSLSLHFISQEIQLMLSSSIPADIVRLYQPPYVMDEWREGPVSRTINCVMYYKVGHVTVM